MPAHPFLDHPRPLAFAHRGGDEVAPENTLRAFRAAVDAGFRYLETDVHLTRDGVLVAFHDESLERVTGHRHQVEDLTLSDLRDLWVAGSDPVPTFDELLEEFPHARFNIDAKTDACVVELAAAVRRHDALDRICVGAFSDRRVLRLRRLLGEHLCTAAGPVQVARLVAASRSRAMWLSPGWPDFHCLQVPVRHLGLTVTSPAFVDAAHRHGVQVHVWTIDEPDEMHRLLDLGVDGIMTDRPSVLRGVLEARGAWT